MKEWLQSYGYLLWVLALVIIVFIVVFYFAVKAYSKHMKTYKEQEAEIKRLTALKEKFKDFDENTIKNTHTDEILEGVALIYQIYLQKKDNMEEEFLNMKQEQQNIYILDVLCSDGSLQTFFKENTDILRCRLSSALSMIGLMEEAEIAHRLIRMYDVNEVEISYSEAELEKADKYFTDNDILSKVKLSSAEYIKKSISLLKL